MLDGDPGANFGIMNALRTGNPIIDVRFWNKDMITFRYDWLRKYGMYWSYYMDVLLQKIVQRSMYR